jgi:hypothetical protein
MYDIAIVKDIGDGRIAVPVERAISIVVKYEGILYEISIQDIICSALTKVIYSNPLEGN